MRKEIVIEDVEIRAQGADQVQVAETPGAEIVLVSPVASESVDLKPCGPCGPCGPTVNPCSPRVCKPLK